MGEFLGNCGFFILMAILMAICHLGHGAHGGHGRGKDAEGEQGGSSPGREHRH